MVSLSQGATRGLIPSWRLPLSAARIRGPRTSRSPNCSPHPPCPSAPCLWGTPSLRKSQGGRSPLCPQEKAGLVTCRRHSPRDPAPATQRLPACLPGITPPSSSREPRPTAVPGQAPPSRPGLCARVPVASSPGRWTPPSRSRSWPPQALLGALLQAPPEPEPCSLTQVCLLIQPPRRAEHLLPSAPALSWSR